MGNLTARRVFGAGFDQPVLVQAGGVTNWYLADRQGTVKAVADGTGAVVASADYDAFGNLTAGTHADRYGYTGLDWDASLGGYRAGDRVYFPDTARWNKEDTKGFDAGDANLYRYVGNNVTNASDPSGMDEYTDNRTAAVNAALRAVAAGQALDSAISVKWMGGKTPNDVFRFLMLDADEYARSMSPTDLRVAAAVSRLAAAPTGQQAAMAKEAIALGGRLEAEALSSRATGSNIYEFDGVKHAMLMRCAVCHGTADGQWQNLAAFPGQERYAPKSQLAALYGTDWRAKDQLLEPFVSRISGTGRVIVGSLGGLTALALAETLIGAPFGAVLAAWSGDQIGTGGREIWTGKMQTSIGSAALQRAIPEDSEYAGWAPLLGIAYDMGPTFVSPRVPSYFGIARRAGAIGAGDIGGQPVLRYLPGPLAEADAALSEIHGILEATESISASQVRQLRVLVDSGRATPAEVAMLTRAYEKSCGNIAAAIDEFMATGTVNPVSFVKKQVFIGTREEMVAARGGEVMGISGHKSVAVQDLLREMRSHGDGAQGVVVFDRVGENGHFINVKRVGDDVYLIDGTLGFAVSLKNHPEAFLSIWDDVGPCR